MFILFKTGLIVYLLCYLNISSKNSVVSMQLALSVTYYSVFTGVCYSFEYNLSVNLIDLMIPKVIQGDFLCLCLLNFLYLSR